MVRIRENDQFHEAKTDYSLKTDYSWVRIETDLFLQQAPVNSLIVTPLATTTAASEPAGVLDRRRPAPRRQHLEVGLGLCRTVCPHCVEHGPTVDGQLYHGPVPGQQGGNSIRESFSLRNGFEFNFESVTFVNFSYFGLFPV